jgi:hypothetical protein
MAKNALNARIIFAKKFTFYQLQSLVINRGIFNKDMWLWSNSNKRAIRYHKTVLFFLWQSGGTRKVDGFLADLGAAGSVVGSAVVFAFLRCLSVCVS